MKVDIWMPVYIGDYLKDTRGLSDAEHGCYLLLLMEYWLNNGHLENDIDRLSRVACSTPERVEYILNKYFIKSGNGYTNNRSDKELKSARLRSESARANVMKRWNKDTIVDTPVIPQYNDSNTMDDTEPIPKGYSSSPSSSLPLQSIKKDKKKYGEYKNVCLTDDELKKLNERFGEKNTAAFIEDLADWLQQHPGKYKSHYAALRNWMRKKDVQPLVSKEWTPPEKPKEEEIKETQELVEGGLLKTYRRKK